MLDTLRVRAMVADSLLAVRTASLTAAESTIVRLKSDSTTTAARKMADSSRIAALEDSLAIFMAFDSQAVRLDSIVSRDSTLFGRLPRMRTLLAHAAYNTGHTVHLRREIPDFERCQIVKAEYSTRNDSTWLTIHRGARSFHDSIPSTHGNRIDRLERDLVRAAFGDTAIPPEPVVKSLSWPARAGILVATATVALVAMVSLW